MSTSCGWGGKGRYVWLIPIADERVGVQVKLWNPLRTRAIPKRFCGGVHYEGALYQVHAPLPFTFNHLTDPHFVTFSSSLYTTIRNPNPTVIQRNPRDPQIVTVQIRYIIRYALHFVACQSLPLRRHLLQYSLPWLYNACGQGRRSHRSWGSWPPLFEAKGDGETKLTLKTQR